MDKKNAEEKRADYTCLIFLLIIFWPVALLAPAGIFIGSYRVVKELDTLTWVPLMCCSGVYLLALCIHFVRYTPCADGLDLKTRIIWLYRVPVAAIIISIAAQLVGLIWSATMRWPWLSPTAASAGLLCIIGGAIISAAIYYSYRTSRRMAASINV